MRNFCPLKAFQECLWSGGAVVSHSLVESINRSCTNTLQRSGVRLLSFQMISVHCLQGSAKAKAWASNGDADSSCITTALATGGCCICGGRRLLLFVLLLQQLELRLQKLHARFRS